MLILAFLDQGSELTFWAGGSPVNGLSWYFHEKNEISSNWMIPCNKYDLSPVKHG